MFCKNLQSSLANNLVWDIFGHSPMTPVSQDLKQGILADHKYPCNIFLFSMKLKSSEEWINDAVILSLSH